MQFWSLRCFRLLVAVCATSGVGFAGEEAEVLLPDIVVRQSDLFDNRITTSGGRKLLRLSNGTANAGAGKLHLYGVFPGNPDGTQDVMQRVYREDGTFFDREAGKFIFHSAHNHIHIESWSRYRLRERLADDGVGDVVAEGEKVSFCILDLGVYDSSLPNFSRTPEFTNCSSTVQGLSVGWIDIYDESLPGQSIDITDVPDGFYWLESEVDPENHMLESNEDNNIARIQITIGDPPAAPDRFEPNNLMEDVIARTVGAPNSPHVGPANPKLVIEDLNINSVEDVDLFRFYSNHWGAAGDLVRIDFDETRGNLDLELLDESGEVVGRSADATPNVHWELISMNALPPGWYTVRVFSDEGETNRDYTLTINPPRNDAPTIKVVTPRAGETRVIHGSDSFIVNWEIDDPEDGLTWVTVFLNETPELDGTEFLVPTTLHTPGHEGLVVLNTAEIPEGNFWVICQVTDGGINAVGTSLGTLYTVELAEECGVKPTSPDDCNGNFWDDACELAAGVRQDCNANDTPDECDIDGISPDDNENGIPDECERALFNRGDVNADGGMDVADGVWLLNFLFSGGATPPCRESADVNNDAEIDVSDAIFALNYLFSGGRRPPDPGPPPTACWLDPDAKGSPGDLGCVSYPPCEAQ